MWNNVPGFILLLILISVRQSSQELCRESQDCNCMLWPPDAYDLRCPRDRNSTFIIEVIVRKSVVMKCNLDPSWADFKLQSTAVDEVDSFKFERCSLPGVPFVEITRRIGVQPVKMLRFESYQNLSSTMERRYLSGLSNLSQLSLNSNGLTELPDDLFDDLPELEILELVQNNVILPHGIFKSLSKLWKLELGSNKIEQIGHSLFKNLTSLKYLGLWGNLLASLDPRTFDGLTALTSLSIAKNELETLPSEVFNPLTNLTSLFMNSNYFSSLPGDLFSLNKNLTKIYLTYNKGNMTTLPPGLFSDLPKLDDIDLKYDRLETLPENLFWGSSALKILDLQTNSLSTLPKELFRDLVNLEKLDLSANKLTNLPDAMFVPLEKLEKLHLQENNLTSISEKMFSGLRSLLELKLQRNGLKTIDFHAFFPLTSLRIAELSHNDIHLEAEFPYQENSPFSNCKNLEKLDLSHNSITRMFNDWYLLLTNLRKLNLAHNKIFHISAQDLQFITREILVDLSYNNITRIDLVDAELIALSQEFKNERNVRITIEGNPLICDCDLGTLLKYLSGEMNPAVQELFHIMPGNLTCGSPESMIGIQISDLHYRDFRCSKYVCPEMCSCSTRQYDKTFFADCSYRNLTVAPERITVDKKYKIQLNLAGNFLKEIPFVNQSGSGNITVMILSNNNISSVSLENIPPMLEVLELHGNNLIKVDTAFLDTMKNSSTLKNLTLHGNPWNCDCETRDFLNFIQTKFKEIPEVSKVVCANDKQPLFKMTANKLCPVAVGRIVGASMAVALLGLLVGISAALYYRYQTEIKVWLFKHELFLCCISEKELDKDKLYDAFISYSSKDEDFVVNKLLPNLEEGPKPFKLCVHFRDWLAGEWIPSQIAKSVEDSRRTVVILSPSFLESIWGRMEFRAAHSQALSEGRARVIVIRLGDIGPTENLDPELKAYLTMNTYIEWGDPWFWDKLRYALPHPPQVAKKAARKIFETHQHHIKIHGEKNGLIHLPGVPITPPPTTTPPADSLKTFIGNGNLNKSILITDVLKEEVRFNDSKLDKTGDDNNLTNNGQCTPV